MRENLYFIDHRKQYRLLAENVTAQEAGVIIAKFLEHHHFKCYYTRTWKIDEGIMHDVGSHTEFFLWGKHNE